MPRTQLHGVRTGDRASQHRPRSGPTAPPISATITAQRPQGRTCRPGEIELNSDDTSPLLPHDHFGDGSRSRLVAPRVRRRAATAAKILCSVVKAATTSISEVAHHLANFNRARAPYNQSHPNSIRLVTPFRSNSHASTSQRLGSDHSYSRSSTSSARRGTIGTRAGHRPHRALVARRFARQAESMRAAAAGRSQRRHRSNGCHQLAKEGGAHGNRDPEQRARGKCSLPRGRW